MKKITPEKESLISLDKFTKEKLSDALLTADEVFFDPDEATRAGAFTEDALSEEDAKESQEDILALIREE